MNEHVEPGVTRVVAPKGVTWTRRCEGRSTGPELLRALSDLRGMHDIARQWNWWQEDRRDQEYERVRGILAELDNGAPATTEDEAEKFAQAEMDRLDCDLEANRQRRADLVARTYDEDPLRLRLRLLRVESGAAFFGHVLAAPASPAQQADAERRVAECQATARELRDQLGDPEQVIDHSGFLPVERRGFNLTSHMQFWRHPVLARG